MRPFFERLRSAAGRQQTIPPCWSRYGRAAPTVLANWPQRSARRASAADDSQLRQEPGSNNCDPDHQLQRGAGQQAADPTKRSDHHAGRVMRATGRPWLTVQEKKEALKKREDPHAQLPAKQVPAALGLLHQAFASSSRYLAVCLGGPAHGGTHAAVKPPLAHESACIIPRQRRDPA